ncbi:MULTISPECIES: restriction endonuclease subunit S [Dermacoccus]|uniref:Restriction endonuclease subunit S n=2 Tax=Dermacoccus TaxID=57495 RepID=A0A417ZA41_9MICO|nr:restriction endonuclease subunit S [Dermacoccus abyssi]RHW47502.1 restriction endonuclease subunit S [Dermacoccus abyssi]
MSLNLDKSHWKRVAFGDVVRNVNETVRDLEAAGINRVIAMEHMDPGELKVSRWGSTEDGTTFTRRVKPGRTLFGKRRAYQRKVAYAEFDAICSGDIYTFEADETQLRGELLPFLVQSNGFFEHALGTSAGSLSPRTNWRDLKDFEFDLPHFEEQKRIADLLWSIERDRAATKRVKEHLVQVRASLIRNCVHGEAEQVALESLIRDDTTITYGIVQAGPEVDGGVPYIRVSDMTSGSLSIRGMKRTSPTIAAKFDRSQVSPGDLVVALRGRTGLTLRVPEELHGANLTQGTARVAIDEKRVASDYVLAIMNSEWMAHQVNRQAKGSTFSELTLAALRGLAIPRLGDQRESWLVANLEQLDAASAKLVETSERSAALRSALMLDVFGGN